MDSVPHETGSSQLLQQVQSTNLESCAGPQIGFLFDQSRHYIPLIYHFPPTCNEQPSLRYMSPFGALPVQCFPDALPHLDAIQAKGIVGTQEQVERLLRLTNIQVLNAGARENP